MQYLGVLLMMGIFKLPQYRMYWSSDLSVPLISTAPTVNRFDKIKQFFHCNDNTNMPQRESPDDDKLFKVRPVIDSLVQNCKKLPVDFACQGESADALKFVRFVLQVGCSILKFF